MKQVKSVEEGYKKLAFGGIGDAVGLLFQGDAPTPQALSKLDLYCVQEIRRTKDGALELRFYDRLRALQCLQEVAGGRQGGALQEALTACASALRDRGDPVQ